MFSSHAPVGFATLNALVEMAAGITKILCIAQMKFEAVFTACFLYHDFVFKFLLKCIGCKLVPSFLRGHSVVFFQHLLTSNLER